MARRILVVGGNAAGLSAASRAVREAPAAEVIVFEATQTPGVSNCNFPYLLSGGIGEPSEVLVHPPEYFSEERGIDLRTGSTVTEVDPIRRRVRVEQANGSTYGETYDRLVYCAGSRARKRDVPGRTGGGVSTLHSYADLERLVECLHAKRKVAVVGGGFTAMSVASALAEKREVSFLYAGDSPLPGLARELAETVTEHLNRRGIRLLPGRRVIGYRRNREGKLVGAETDAGNVECEHVIEFDGVIPNVEPLGGGLELDPVSGAICVDRRQSTSNDAVYAAGDCATVGHALLRGRHHVPNGALANRAGRVAGCNAGGGFSKSAPVLGTRATELNGLELAQTGLSLTQARNAGYDALEVVIHAPLHAAIHLARAVLHGSAVAERGKGRLLGVSLAGPYGAGHRINAAATAIAAGMDLETAGGLDYAYHPRSSPVWDPLLVLYRRAAKALIGG